jgi:hypothetical protein
VEERKRLEEEARKQREDQAKKLREEEERRLGEQARKQREVEEQAKTDAEAKAKKVSPTHNAPPLAWLVSSCGPLDCGCRMLHVSSMARSFAMGDWELVHSTASVATPSCNVSTQTKREHARPPCHIHQRLIE